MPTGNDPELQRLDKWVYRLRMPDSKVKGILVLIHGWMGDENSMWVIARNITPEKAILAPRGLYEVPKGGYSWREIIPGTWGNATLDDLRPSADALVKLVDNWATSAEIDGNQFDLMGFSQGAAMSYTLALLYPQRVGKLAALSGFIPEGGIDLLKDHRLFGKPVYISHGRKDDLIPVDQSRNAATQLEAGGAVVTYCESDAGHKISKECLKEAELFFGKS